MVFRKLVYVLVIFGAQAASAESLLVASAANFTGAMRELAQEFQAQSGHRVRVSYGSTGKLYTQIENGAPFDLFLAADEARPLRAEKSGLAVAGTRFTYAIGQLVLWSPDRSGFKSGEQYLREGMFQRLAIANPKTAPYGAAAKEVLVGLGVWEQLKHKIVRGDSIAQTFQFTATGNAQAGLVAASQVTVGKYSEGSKWMVPAAYHVPLMQQAVLLKNGEGKKSGREFLGFLKGPRARAIIAKHGYALSEIPGVEKQDANVAR